MKELLITIIFDDPTGKFWWDSYLKKKVVKFDPDKQTIHDVVKKACESVGMELSYKGKPQEVLYDDNDNVKGYAYRGKGEIYDRNINKPAMVFWDIFLTSVKEITKFELQEI